MHIQCDEDLINQFDNNQLISKQSLVVDRDSTILGSWHAGIVSILGNEFLIYVHSKSLYSAVDFLDFSSDPQLNQSVVNLRGKILEMLDEEYYLTDHQVTQLIRPFQTVTFGYMQDKRMARIIHGIGVAYQKRFMQVRQQSSNGEVRLWELEEDLNSTARRNLGGATPAETLLALVRSGVN